VDVDVDVDEDEDEDEKEAVKEGDFVVVDFEVEDYRNDEEERVDNYCFDVEVTTVSVVGNRKEENGFFLKVGMVDDGKYSCPCDYALPLACWNVEMNELEELDVDDKIGKKKNEVNGEVNGEGTVDYWIDLQIEPDDDDDEDYDELGVEVENQIFFLDYCRFYCNCLDAQNCYCCIYLGRID